MATKEQLIAWFANGLAATGEKFEALITSLKGRQSPVSDPTASGTSVTFIASISQDEEGVITATKKYVSFSGYQTIAGMSAYQTVAGMSAYQTVAGMASYQQLDLQKVGDVTAAAGGSQTINHNMKHYPTVRLMDANGEEVDTREFTVKHADNMTLSITLGGSLTDSYKYILD